MTKIMEVIKDPFNLNLMEEYKVTVYTPSEELSFLGVFSPVSKKDLMYGAIRFRITDPLSSGLKPTDYFTVRKAYCSWKAEKLNPKDFMDDFLLQILKDQLRK